jgi:hypothetical protein
MAVSIQKYEIAFLTLRQTERERARKCERINAKSKSHLAIPFLEPIALSNASPFQLTKVFS